MGYNSATPWSGVVVAGKAQPGATDSVRVLSRLQTKPVVLPAQIFRHSSLAFLTLQKSDIRTPDDLAGEVSGPGGLLACLYGMGHAWKC